MKQIDYLKEKEKRDIKLKLIELEIQLDKNKLDTKYWLTISISFGTLVFIIEKLYSLDRFHSAQYLSYSILSFVVIFIMSLSLFLIRFFEVKLYRESEKKYYSIIKQIK